MITHFNDVLEEYFGESIVLGVDPINETNTLDVIKEIKPIDKYQLKEYMSKNRYVKIDRFSIVVSENTDKNTISLKLFKFSKRFVTVRKSKRRRFKIDKKDSISLTINKTNGDFTFYFYSKNKKPYFIKNMLLGDITQRFSNILSDEDIINKINIEIAAVLFYNLLGYNQFNILNYNSLINHFFDKENNNYLDVSVIKTITLLPFLNYLKLNNINIKSSKLLNYFITIFRKNKNKFKNCDIIDYMAYYYNIDDRELLKNVLNLLLSHYSVPKTIDNGINDYLKITSRPLNDMYLKLYHDLKCEDVFSWYSFTQVDSVGLAAALQYDRGLYHKVLNLFKTYEIPLTDKYFLSKTDIATSIKKIDMLEMFNIKIHGNKHHLLLNKKFMIKLMFILSLAVNKSGLTYVDKKTFNRVKLYFKKHNLEFLTTPKLKIKTYEEYNESISEVETNTRLFDFEFSDPVSELFDKCNIILRIYNNKNNVLVLNINPVKGTVNTLRKIFEVNEVKNLSDNFKLNFITNKNNLRCDLKFKYIFSKKYFEELFYKEFTYKPSEVIGYIEN